MKTIVSRNTIETNNISDNGMVYENIFVSQETKEAENNDGVIIGRTSPLTNIVSGGNGVKKYKVRKGDKLPVLATRFNISKETITRANNGATSFREGQVITILPVTGILYNIQESDTLESVTNRYSVKEEDIAQYNPTYREMMLDGKGTFILPFANMNAKREQIVSRTLLPRLPDYFSLPIKGWNWGELHTENAIDIASKCGAAVLAAQEGVVVPDEKLGEGGSGWNSGYGTFVLLEHPNGTKTRYARLEKTKAYLGEIVARGEEIGKVGATGSAHGPSGCFLHFEVLGAQNPFAGK